MNEVVPVDEQQQASSKNQRRQKNWLEGIFKGLRDFEEMRWNFGSRKLL